MSYDHLALERGAETWLATVDRERDRNSVDTPLMGELRSLVLEAERAGARALVLAGRGKTHFVGGADGVEMMRLDPAGARAFSARFQALLDRLEASPLVTVAAIDGLCFGGGLELALACDLRVATESSRIGLPEVKVGLIPGGGGTQRLPRLVGLGRAMELVLSGRLCTAREAAELGIVNAVVSDSGLEAGVGRLLEPILARPAHAVRLAKAAVHGSRSALDEGLAVERERFAECFEHGTFAELMRRQLREGVLQTTAEVADLLAEPAGAGPEEP